MDHARTEGSPTAHSAFGLPVSDGAWPFPSRPARRAAHPELEGAALDVLAATARAWGLPRRVPWPRQAS
jgi:hypothetical protein